MLFCPVIWPNDTAVCYPFNRTLLDPSQPESLRKSVATYLGVGTTAALVTRPVKCAIDYPTGLSILHYPVPRGVYLMWARPLTRSDAQRDDLFATNDLASDLIQFGNRTQSDWSTRVEVARSGRHGVYVDSVVTGPAILFYRDPKDGRHASVDIDLIIRNKMGNAGSWFGSAPEGESGVLSPSPSPPPLVATVQERPPLPTYELRAMDGLATIPVYRLTGELRSERRVTTTEVVPVEKSVSNAVEVKDPPPLAIVSPPQQQNGPEADDADDPLASHEIPPLVAADTLFRPVEKEEAAVVVVPLAPVPKEETPPESSPKRRKRTPIVTHPATPPMEKTVYQTRRRSGIQKVNPRYAK